MLQTLLEDRFKLRWHRETREGPVYVLSGPAEATSSAHRKMALSQLDPDKPLPAPPPGRTQRVCGNNWLNGNGPMIVWSAYSIDMDKVAGTIGMFTGRKVVNKTGVTGLFDIDLELPRLQPWPATTWLPPKVTRSPFCASSSDWYSSQARVRSSISSSTRSPGLRRTEMAKLPFCLCGVRGGDLKQRIESIMSSSRRTELTRLGGAFSSRGRRLLGAPLVVVDSNSRPGAGRPARSRAHRWSLKWRLSDRTNRARSPRRSTTCPAGGLSPQTRRPEC